MRSLLLVLCLSALSVSACAPPPPSLSSAAVRAFNNTRVLRVLDLVRDTAIDAQAQTPPLLSADATRQVVLWHGSALRVIHAAESGWQAAVVASLESLQVNLPPEARALLGRYLTMAKAIIQELR